MSEHNQPNQQVGNQYNADSINIHHHSSPSDPSPPTREEIARVVEKLHEFKSLFASASPAEVLPLLEQAEDLLLFVCGERRFRELLEQATCIHKLTEYYEKDRNDYYLRANAEWGWEKVKELLPSLKRRVAGIESRMRW